METFISNSIEETRKIASNLCKTLNNDDIIFFTGGLGMGKTAFCQGLCDGFNIDVVATSPTFSIVNHYTNNINSIFHFDMYRIENEDQLFNIGFDDYLDYDGILAIEWSENIKDFFNDYTIKIDFEKLSENQRKITIERV